MPRLNPRASRGADVSLLLVNERMEGAYGLLSQGGALAGARAAGMGPRHDAGEMRYDTMRCDAMADWHTRGNGFNADHDDRLSEAPGQCPHLRAMLR